METPQDTTSVNPNQTLSNSDLNKISQKNKIIAVLSRIYAFSRQDIGLEVRKKIFRVILFGIIMSIILIMLFHSHIDSGSISVFMVIIFLISLILGILFLMNENKRVLDNFMSTGIQPGIAPGSKYGLFLYFCSIIIYLSYIFIDGEPGFSIKDMLLAIMQFMIFLGTIYIYNGSKKSKMTFIRKGDIIPRRIFSEDGSIIGSIIFILIIGGLLLGGLAIMSLGSIGHGRFLFFGFNRKPRKAIIKDGRGWLIKN